ncbi:MAG: hypothetical protein V4632_22610 [Pseudomonadota bacterium]
MTEGYRKAALRLHGLSSADRDWMLQRLDTQEQARLGDLLRELRELGIQAEHCVPDEIEARPNVANADEELAGVADALALMRAASVPEITALLSAEPDHVAAAVLAVYPWPWRPRLLAAYGVEMRQRLARVLQSAPTLAPRVRTELIQLLAERLALLRQQGFAGAEETAGDCKAMNKKSPPFWQGVWQWLR